MFFFFGVEYGTQDLMVARPNILPLNYIHPSWSLVFNRGVARKPASWMQLKAEPM